MTEWYGVANTDTPDDDESDRRERLVAAWPDAPTSNLEVCSFLLEIARLQVISYASDAALSARVDQLLTRLGYTPEAVTAVLTAVGSQLAAADAEALETDLTDLFADLTDPDEAVSDALNALDDYTTSYPPQNYVYAQLKQAENLWNAGRVGSDGGFGDDGAFNFTPRPLDKVIRHIIRPVEGGPHIV